MKQPLSLTDEEKELLLEALFRQNLAKEIVASTIRDLENGIDKENEALLKQLSILYDRLV